MADESVDGERTMASDEPQDSVGESSESTDSPDGQDDSSSEDAAEETDSSDAPDDSSSEDAAEETISSDAPDDSSSEDAAEETDSSDAPDSSEVAEGTDSATREPKTDGDGFVGDRQERSETPEYPDPDEDIGGISTPPDDQEMPLADHIEEMILRLAVVLLFGSAGTAIGLLWASEAIEFIWLNVFPLEAEQVPPPHVYHPLELWLTRIKVAALLGIMVALPMFVYQCYLFMRPGLYPNERKYYIAAVPSSVVLASVGMLFSFFLVLPVLFRYFTFYANPEGEGSAYSVDIAYALAETFDLIVTLTGFLAIVFQIPLFIMLAIMMGVTTRRWLAAKRLYFWAAFGGLAFMFTMDPTMMAPILVAITMILLFEGTLLVLKWTGR